MTVEPYANIPYRKGESKSKLGVQYPKNLHVPVKPLREMDDVNLGNSPVKQEMRNIKEEIDSEDRPNIDTISNKNRKVEREEQVLENVANP